MKKLILSIIIGFLNFILIAQDINISFRPKVSGTLIDSIWVMNQRTGQVIKLTENESLILTKATGTNETDYGQSQGLVFPNPSDGQATLSFTSVTPEKVRVEVYNALGQLLASSWQELNQGKHNYRIDFSGEGMYFISVFKNDRILTFKTFQNTNKRKECSISYEGSEDQQQSKHALIEKAMIYAPGDILYSSAHSGKNTTVMTDSPGSDMIYFIDFFECVDADNRNYKVVVIDKMIWMAENLAYLPAVSPSLEGSLTDPVYYVNGYNGKSVDEAKSTAVYKNYGVLYNWPAAKTACPAGWRLPSDTEWKKLELALGMTQAQADTTGERGTDQGTKMKTSNGWYNNGNGTNAAGFSGLPGGNRASNGYFYYLGQRGFWWSSTDFLTAFACYRHLAFDANGVTRTTTGKDWGFSVRCVRY